MNSRHSFACIAACLALTVTANAAEITLFEKQNFQGRSVTFNGEANNLDPTGFNDRAESAIVRSGVWEGCVDAYFQGRCTQLRPGEYPRLDRDFERRISSLRVLQGNEYHSQTYGGQYYPRDTYREGTDARDRAYDRGYYGYPYRDHGQ